MAALVAGPLLIPMAPVSVASASTSVATSPVRVETNEYQRADQEIGGPPGPVNCNVTVTNATQLLTYDIPGTTSLFTVCIAAGAVITPPDEIRWMRPHSVIAGLGTGANQARIAGRITVGADDVTVRDLVISYTRAPVRLWADNVSLIDSTVSASVGDCVQVGYLEGFSENSLPEDAPVPPLGTDYPTDRNHKYHKASHVLITGNSIGGCADDDTFLRSDVTCGAAGAPAIYSAWAQDVEISENVLHDTPLRGIQIYPWNENVRIVNNLLRANSIGMNIGTGKDYQQAHAITVTGNVFAEQTSAELAATYPRLRGPNVSPPGGMCAGNVYLTDNSPPNSTIDDQASNYDDTTFVDPSGAITGNCGRDMRPRPGQEGSVYLPWSSNRNEAATFVSPDDDHQTAQSPCAAYGPVRFRPAATGSVSGTVVDANTLAPVASAGVIAMRTSNFSVAGGAVANGAGQYALQLPAGSYFLYAIDSSGGHAPGFFGAPTAVNVVENGHEFFNKSMIPTRGSISGILTDTPSGARAPGMWALAIGNSGLAGAAVSDANGAYTVEGLPAGSYRATFVDPTGSRPQEYYDNSPTFEGATALSVTGGVSSSADAALTNAGAVPQISMGVSHTCAVLASGALKCWGLNSSGQLGLGDMSNRGDGAGEMASLPTVNLGTGRTARAVAAGGSHTCALLDNATVKCWGLNTDGQLGLGNVATRGDGANEMGDNLPTVNLGTGRTALAITAGASFTCALLDNGSVKCWGLNTSGQLGLGDALARGDGANEMGNNLPAVSLGTGRTATALSARAAHICARLDNATVKCWGLNTNGQLGLGDTLARGDGANEMGNSLPAVSLGTGRTATTVTTGSTHSCALLDNASVKCWGNGANAQLGLGNTTTRGDGANEMGDNLPAVSLGTGRTVTALSAGGSHTCALLDDRSLKCWGANAFGQLGRGDVTPRGDNAGEMGDALPAVDLGAGRTVTTPVGGNAHSCAILDTGSIRCWGSNAAGQLGVGDVANRGDGANEMGNNLPLVRVMPSGLLSGTITDASNASPIPGAYVVLLDAADFSVAGGAVASASGAYTIQAPPNSYYLYGIDPSTAHTPGFLSGGSVEVAYGSNGVRNGTLPTTQGTMSGTVTADPSGQPLAGVWVLAIDANGRIRGAITNASGGYTHGGLPAGTYRTAFVDPSGARSLEYFNNSPDFPGATPINITAGGTTANINAALAQP